MIFVPKTPSLYTRLVSLHFSHHCLQCGSNWYASNDKRLTLQCIYASMPFPLMPLCTGLFVCTLLVAGLHASLCLRHSVLQHRPLRQLLSALSSSSAIILACQLACCDVGLCPYTCLLLYWSCLPDCTLPSFFFEISVVHSHTGIRK